MRALKTLVIAMGIAILIGASVLATLIFERAGRIGGSAPVSKSSGTAMRLELPAGAAIIESRLDGGRLLLRARLADGREALFVFDAADGRIAARYDIAAGGAR